MRIKIQYFLLISAFWFLTINASYPIQKSTPSQKSNFPVDLNIGYSLNPLNGDSISPMITTLGDTIPSGIALKLWGKHIEKNQRPKPKTFQISESEFQDPLGPVYELDTVKRMYLPLDTFTIHKKNTTNPPFHLIDRNGDTIPSGIFYNYAERKSEITIPTTKEVKALGSEEKMLGQLKILDISHDIDPLYEEYLSHSPVRGPKGNLWIGGLGLKRYDGRFVQKFLKSNGLSEDMVIDLQMDQKGNLWIVHKNSISRFDGYAFHILDESNGLPANISFFDIYCDKMGDLWIGSDKGLIQIKNGQLKFFTTNEGLPFNEVTGIQGNVEDGLFLNHNKNYSFLNTEGVRHLNFYDYRNKKEFISGTRSMYLSQSKGLWFGLFAARSQIMNYKDDFLTVLEFSSPANPELKKEKEIAVVQSMSFTEDNDHNIWLGSWVAGVYKIDNQNRVFSYNSKNAINDDFVLNLSFDEFGNLWCGTRNNGYNIINSLSFPLYNTLENFDFKYTWQIASNENATWFASRYGGISRLENNQFVKLESGDINIFHLSRSIILDHKNRIWFGSNEMNGIIRLEGNQASQYQLELLAFNDYSKKQYRFGYSDAGQSLLEDDKHRIWISNKEVDSDIAMIDENENITYYYEYPVGATSFCSAKDNNGNLWFGGNSLKKIIEGDSIIHFTPKEGMFFNEISSLFIDDKNQIWIGSKEGIAAFDGQSFSYLNEKNGLSSNSITAIMQSKTGEIIAIHPMGISVIELNSDKDFLIRTFDHNDGLQGKSNYDNSAFVDQNNDLWIGSGIGINKISLDSLLTKPNPSSVYLTEIRINGNSLKYKQLEKEIQVQIQFEELESFSFLPINPILDYALNHITFIFSSPDILNKENLEYSFRLNENEAWSNTFKSQELDLRNMSFGVYELQLKSRYENGDWGPTLIYPFEILAPWYLTYWAITVYTLAFIIMLYSLYRFQLNRQLEKQEAIQLKEIDGIKTRFFTNISHEFRTPLTLIKGISENLKESFSSNDKPGFNKKVDVLRRNSSQLLTLVNQLLDISKLESGKLELEKKAIDLKKFTTNAISAYDSAFQAKGLNIIFECAQNELIVMADEKTLNHILHNLLGNALKFTQSGEVKVKIDKSNDDIAHLTVSDTGIGIPEEELPFIFDRFYQVNHSSTRDFEGTGIGLSLTKELVELIGGKIHVESKLGIGSTFHLDIPMQGEGKSEMIEELAPLEEYKSNQENVGADELILDESKPTLLLVEDNSDMQYFIKDVLKQDYNIVTANNGENGFQKALEYIPDFIISDWMMPIKTGPEMLQEIKSNMLTSHIPCMLLTARADQDSKLSGYKYGAEAYLTKPFEPEELKHQIQALIKSRDLIRKYFEVNFPKKVKVEKFDAEGEFMSKVIETINNNMADSNLDGHKLAKELILGRSQFARKLKAISNLSITQIIRQQRIAKAKILLEEGKLNVSEIAYDIGFNDPAYFSRIFSQDVGIAPSEYIEKS